MGQRNSAPSHDDIALLRKHEDKKMEEELALRNLQFIQKRAIECADRREHLSWELMAGGTMAILLLLAGSMYQRKDFIIPIVPIIMGIGYRYDAAYGGQQIQIRDTAEALLRKDAKRFDLIGGPITLAQVDAFRQNIET